MVPLFLFFFPLCSQNTTDPYNNTGPSHPALERGSYGVGMVGIGSGVGAYGAR